MKNELECRSKMMCIRVGFYVNVVHVIVKKEVSTLTPRMDLSLRTRVYIRGSRWVGHLFEFRPVRSDTSLQIPIKRSLDLFWLMWWISYLGFWYDSVARQPSAWICHLSNLLKRFGRSWWCLSVTVIHQRLAILAKRAS